MFCSLDCELPYYQNLFETVCHLSGPQYGSALVWVKQRGRTVVWGLEYLKDSWFWFVCFVFQGLFLFLR